MVLLILHLCPFLVRLLLVIFIFDYFNFLLYFLKILQITLLLTLCCLFNLLFYRKLPFKPIFICFWLLFYTKIKWDLFIIKFCQIIVNLWIYLFLSFKEVNFSSNLRRCFRPLLGMNSKQIDLSLGIINFYLSFWYFLGVVVIESIIKIKIFRLFYK